MIEKIRRELVLKYTLAIAAALLLFAAASHTVQKYNNLQFVHESLGDYLEEEVWEARKRLAAAPEKAEIHKIASEADSFHNYTFWYAGGRLIHAEEPLEENVAAQIKERLAHKKYEDGKIYHENMKGGGRKWYFMVMKKTVLADDAPAGEIFVLFNYTGMRKSAKSYGFLAAGTALLLAALAWLTGNWMVKKSIGYISRTYERQKQFVADASHELRTPLAVLTGYAELLEYRYEQSELTRDMKKELDNMASLLDALLEIARYDNEREAMRLERFDLSLLAREAAKAAQALCLRGNVSFGGDGGVFLTADKRLIRQLINIFVDNALKYTPEDKLIEITATHSGGRTTLSVKDNGIGIAEKERNLIFERFYRVDKSRNAKIKGTGLGLAIAAAIAKMHGAEIAVESEPGKGSVFRVIF